MAGMKADGNAVAASQAGTLVGAPSFPNCVKFSETNLLAVASGHLVTVLDPAALSGPRGFIPVTTSSLFDVGNVQKEGLQAGSLLPYILFRDPRPGVRSMDWSPSGLAQNGGCLLAVCTTDNRVKVYREPFSDFQSDWVEIMDFSEMAYSYCVENDFRECELVSAQIAMQDDSMPPPSDWGLPVKRKHVAEHEEVEEPQHRKTRPLNHGGVALSSFAGHLIHTRVTSVDSRKGCTITKSKVIPAVGGPQESPADTPGEASGEGGRSSSELGLVLTNVLESATSAGPEENAGAQPRGSPSVTEISNGEVLLMLDEPNAATDSHSRDQECVHKAGDAEVSILGDNDPNENLASVLARRQKLTKVYARRPAASGTSLATAGSCLLSADPDVGTCKLENTSARPARMRKLPRRFQDGGEVVPEETIKGSSPVNRVPVKRRFVGREKLVANVEENAVIYVNKETLGHVVRDVDVVEPMTDLVDSSEVMLEGSNHLPPSLKHTRSLKSKLDDKIRIAADYVARTELLSPLAVAWSPKCQAAERVDNVELNKPHSFALLGAGTKSGRVSIWRIMYPPYYSTDHVNRHVEARFLGFLDAHTSWVTSLCWASCNFDLMKVNMVSPNNFVALSREKVLLVTGCADGSVKIWAARSDSLISASSKQSLPIAFCKQVGKADSVPVTSLALVVLSQRSDRALLAVGKGSGSLAIYEIMPSGVCHQLCNLDGAHQQTVTGLSWRFDGSCLYSCGQDSLKIWEFLETELNPLKFPDWSAVFPTIISPDLCSADAMQSFFGVALSHNCLALATVRDVDNDVLDQMYQARSQKAVVQMFWLGIKPTAVKKNVGSVSVPKGMTVNEIAGWKVNIVSALQHLEDPKGSLVLWDVMAAVSLLKEAVGGESVVTILSEWLTGWTRGEDALGAVESSERPAKHFEKAVSEASCRQLHILNVIYRRLLLVHLKPEVINASSCKNIPPIETGITVTRDEKLWRKCLYVVEHEIRQRLIHLRLCKVTHREEELEHVQEDGSVGTLLTAKWVLENSSSVSPELSKVATQLRKSHRNRFRSYYSETCPFCESTVIFDSPETATCQGTGTGTANDRHQLQRCSVSMQVCPPTGQWYCSCCQRRAIEQAPSLFFGLSSRSQILEVSTHALRQSDAYPSCPFCGVLMHRLLPNFFLTSSLV